MNALVEVSKEVFFAWVGPRDIVSSAHSQPPGSTHRAPYSLFKTRSGDLVGRWCSGVYWLRSDLVQK